MRILHFYDQTKEIQARYVHLLEETMSASAELTICSSLQEVRHLLEKTPYDLLHIHGCWAQRYAKAAAAARQHGTRVIITPHGVLEPWVLKEREWQEKLPKMLLYQRRTIQEAYVVIAMGKMETDCLHKLGWNPRIETVRNPLITHSISREEMTHQLFTIYRRVMDSDQLSLMTTDERDTLFLLLKAGICGSKEWIAQADSSPLTLQSSLWRRFFIYARDEQVENQLKRGISVLNIDTPYIDVNNVESYFPTGYEPPKTIASVIGNQYATENERLLATFRHVQYLVQHNKLSICHLLELEKEIREHDIDEAQLAETLTENRLMRFAQYIMGVLHRITGFEEGMMPVDATDDKETARIERMITKHLSI